MAMADPWDNAPISNLRHLVTAAFFKATDFVGSVLYVHPDVRINTNPFKVWLKHSHLHAFTVSDS